MSFSQPRAPPSTPRSPIGKLASGGGGVVSKGQPQPHRERRREEQGHPNPTLHSIIPLLHQAFCPPIARNPGLSPGQVLSFPCPASRPGLVLRSQNQVQ